MNKIVMNFFSLPIAKYTASRSIKQRFVPATSERVSQETCTHFICRCMINATSCCMVTFILKENFTKHERLRSSENGSITYPVYDTVWCKL